MHCEQSRVGKVSESWLMWPPIEDSFSTSTTSAPPSARSSAAWMPAIPPPITRARRSIGMRIVSSGALALTFSTSVRVIAIALRVACSRSSWIHEHCSRMLAISQRKGFSPAAEVTLRNVRSCMCGEHAATTTPVSAFAAIASRTRVCPGSEHMYL